jgi:hypothetical protein
MGYDFPIKYKEFFSCNILEGNVGSNCPCGGDGGHGGKTYLKITDGGNTGWNITIEESNGTEYHFEQPKSIALELLGDIENETFIKLLDFALKELLMTYLAESKKNKF